MAGKRRTGLQAGEVGTKVVRPRLSGAQHETTTNERKHIDAEKNGCFQGCWTMTRCEAKWS
jgi:hypothetical protein